MRIEYIASTDEVIYGVQINIQFVCVSMCFHAHVHDCGYLCVNSQADDQATQNIAWPTSFTACLSQPYLPISSLNTSAWPYLAAAMTPVQPCCRGQCTEQCVREF